MSEQTPNASEPKRPTILVVDDEIDTLQLMAEALEATALRGQASMAPMPSIASVVLRTTLDRRPAAAGLRRHDVLDEALSRYPEIRRLSSPDLALPDAVQPSAARRGLPDQTVPAEPARARAARGFEQQRLRKENAELRSQLHDRFRFESIVGSSAPMQHVFSTLELVSPMNSTC